MFRLLFVLTALLSPGPAAAAQSPAPEARQSAAVDAALSQSVTMGIISNTEMIMPGMFWPFNRMTLEGEDVGSIVRWIGHDAPIFGGNSGGPLVNMEGKIVGINEISMGLAGAIPADLAKEVATALIKEGKVRRGWIGLEIQ